MITMRIVSSLRPAPRYARLLAYVAGAGLSLVGPVACVTGRPQPTASFSGVPQKPTDVNAIEVFQGPPPPRPWVDVGTVEVTCPADAYASGHGSLDIEGSCTLEAAIKLAREKLAEVGADGMYAISTNSMGGGRLIGLSATAFRYEGGPRPRAPQPRPEPPVDPSGKPVLVVHGASGAVVPPSTSGAPSVPSTGAGGAKIPVEERLRRLQELRDKGLISPEDYEKKKAEILRDL
jgi:hypothetical protein